MYRSTPNIYYSAFKKIIGALARQFTLGILGNEAKKCKCINTIKRYAYSKDYKVEDRDLNIKYDF